MVTQKQHKNIRGSEYYTQAIKEAAKREKEITTPILRLREFVNWIKQQGLCKSEYDFERKCGLSPKYITNNAHSGKGNIGTEMLGRIIRVFPQLNLAWLCIGQGAMLNEGAGDVNADYKQAYEAAQKQIEALNRIIQSNNV